MLELKFVGPKPIISHTGIEFDNNKDDKYNYLNIVVQLLKAIDHEYFDDKTYVYQSDTSRLSSEELFCELKKYCSNIDSLMERENHNVEEEIERQLIRANESATLKDADKEVLQNNINLMHDYLIQRSINKAIYYCAINALAELLRRGHIDHIIVPMFQKFVHVLHSVEGSLKTHKNPIETKLDIYKEDGKLLVKLQLLRRH